VTRVSRPNKPREVYAESHVADRIANERKSRGWSLEGLAKRMTDAGCAIDQSAIFKIEQGRPRRRINIDEFVVFSRVFAVPLDELLLPPEVVASKELGRLVIEWNFAREAAADAAQMGDMAWEAVRAFVAARPDAEGALERIMETWAAFYFDDEDKDYAIARQMRAATDSKKWADRVRAEIQRG